MGISKGAVKQHTFRAMSSLGALLERTALTQNLPVRPAPVTNDG
jgi:hypothetical protein